MGLLQLWADYDEATERIPPMCSKHKTSLHSGAGVEARGTRGGIASA